MTWFLGGQNLCLSLFWGLMKFHEPPTARGKMQFLRHAGPEPWITWWEIVLLRQISHLSRSQLHIAVIHDPWLNRFQPPYTALFWCISSSVLAWWAWLCALGVKVAFFKPGFLTHSKQLYTQRRWRLNKVVRKPFQATRNQSCATWAYKHDAPAQCCKLSSPIQCLWSKFPTFLWAAEAEHAWNIDLYTSDHPVLHSHLQPLDPQTLPHFENEVQALQKSNGGTARYDCQKARISFRLGLWLQIWFPKQNPSKHGNLELRPIIHMFPEM